MAGSSTQASASASRHVAAYDIIRALAMVLVIAGHSSYYTMLSPLGGIDYLRWMAEAGVSDTALHGWTDELARGIYTFHMRVFFALSGAVFYLRLRQGAYDGVAAFLRKKARRLLVPFVLATAFYAVPVKLAAGYWTGDALEVACGILGHFFLLGNSHLWFLVAIFGSFAVVGWAVLGHPRVRAWILATHAWRVEAVLAAIVAVLLLADGTAAHLAIDAIHRRGGYWLLIEAPVANFTSFVWGTLWMIVGMRLEQARERLAGRRLPAAVLAAALAVLLVALWSGCAWEMHWQIPPMRRYVVLDEAVRLGLAVAGVTACWLAGWLLARTRAARARVVQAFSRDTMGVYLYSDPLNYAILAAFAAAFGPAAFGTTEGTAALVAMRFFGTLLIGWGVTIVVRRVSNFR